MDKFSKFFIIISKKNNVNNSLEKIKKVISPNNVDTIFFNCSNLSIDKFEQFENTYTLRSEEEILYVFLNFDSLKNNFQNKFLKILEEPISGKNFVITTSNIESITKTIVSRGIVLNESSEDDNASFSNAGKKGAKNIEYFLNNILDHSINIEDEKELDKIKTYIDISSSIISNKEVSDISKIIGDINMVTFDNVIFSIYFIKILMFVLLESKINDSKLLKKIIQLLNDVSVINNTNIIKSMLISAFIE